MIINRILLSLPFLFFASVSPASGQESSKANSIEEMADTTQLNTYLITREIPNAGQLSAADLKGISGKSCEVIEKMGQDIEWVESFVASDHVFCIYRSKNTNLIEQHAVAAGFPITSIKKIANTIGPATAK